MFTRLTEDLLDLVAAEEGCGGARLAVALQACCSCSCLHLHRVLLSR